MVEKVPFPLELNDRMMGCPSQNRGQDITLEYKWSGWILAGGISNEMCITGGIGEIVDAVIFVHPGCLEKPSGMITSQ